MAIKIIEEQFDTLSEYEKVPIAFWVRSRFRLDSLEVGPTYVDDPVEPYLKDYDAYERPSQWPERFDTSDWGIFAAFDGDKRIGGAATAWKTPELDLLEGNDDLVCLWDLRVHPEYRNRGVGHALFKAVVRWGIDRDCRQLIVETQDVNVTACRFYARQGCELRSVTTDVYPAELNEVQLLWYLDLYVPK